MNPDSYASTGQGILGANMFAYARNNPVSYVDYSGSFPIIVLVAAAAVALTGIDHWLAANQPEDGFAYGEMQNESETAMSRCLYAKGHGFELNKNGVTLFDLEAGISSIVFKIRQTTVELFDFCTVSATAEVDWSGLPCLNVSAIASIYSASAETVIPLGIGELTIIGEIHLGAIGTGIEFDVEEGKFKVTPPIRGVGTSIEFDFDFK